MELNNQTQTSHTGNNRQPDQYFKINHQESTFSSKQNSQFDIMESNVKQPDEEAKDQNVNLLEQ